MSLFRELRPDELELRVGQVSQKGMSLLLYKDARCDQRVLDETFTPFGWKSEVVESDPAHAVVRVFAKDPQTGEWAHKEDVGTAGNFEPEKSAVSDAFKRACFQWGIGRALYTAPRIFLGCPTHKEGNFWKLDNYSDQYGWSVDSIEYEEGKISKLVLAKDGKVVWWWPEVKS